MHSTIFNYLNPVIFTVFGFPIRWYGLAYVLGAVLGYLMFQYNAQKVCKLNLGPKFYDDLIFYMLLCAIIGGRLGEVIIYDLSYYLGNPLEIFKLYKGGMSFHGGLLGCILGCYFLAKKHKVTFLQTADLLCTAAPIGLFLGRLANFINAELIGKPTQLPWGVVFPNTSGVLRHPSQIYEALSEGVLMFVILNLVLRLQYKATSNARNPKPSIGIVSSMFIMLYSGFRFLIEYLKEPYGMVSNWKLQFFGVQIFEINRGQTLSLIMFMVGCIMLIDIIYRGKLNTKRLRKNNNDVKKLKVDGKNR